MISNSERGYKAALQEFWDRYGDADIIALSYVRKALDCPVIKTEDAPDHLKYRFIKATFNMGEILS